MELVLVICVIFFIELIVILLSFAIGYGICARKYQPDPEDHT